MMGKEAWLAVALVVVMCSTAEAQTTKEWPPGFFKDVRVEVACSMGTEAAAVTLIIPETTPTWREGLGSCGTALHQGAGLMLSKFTYQVKAPECDPAGPPPLGPCPGGVGVSVFFTIFNKSGGWPKNFRLVVPITLNFLSSHNLMPIEVSGGNPVVVPLTLETVVFPGVVRKKMFRVLCGRRVVARSHLLLPIDW